MTKRIPKIISVEENSKKSHHPSNNLQLYTLSEEIFNRIIPVVSGGLGIMISFAGVYLVAGFRWKWKDWLMTCVRRSVKSGLFQWEITRLLRSVFLPLSLMHAMILLIA